MNGDGKAASDEGAEMAPPVDEVSPKIVHNLHDGNVDVRLDPTAQALIGHHLKTMYEEVVNQDVPEHLLRLLEELERKEGHA